MTKPTSNWRDLMKVHPAAEMFPLMSPEELKELGEDIKANELTDPVTTWVDKDGTEWLLDGRNRLDAMATVGYRFKLHGQFISFGKRKGQREPERFKVLPPNGAASRWALSYVSHYFGSDPYAYVDSANIKRRHLSIDDRKHIAEELLKARPDRSDRSIAKEVGISHVKVAGVRAEGEASGQIDHIAPTERVDAGGRKRARKTASKVKTAEAQPEQPAAEDQPRVVDDAPASEAELSVPSSSAVAAEDEAKSEGNLDFETLLDEVSWNNDLTDAQKLELADAAVSRLPEERVNELFREYQWMRWDPSAYDTPHVPGYTISRPLMEIKILARAEWQMQALENEPTNPEEATIRYNAISWEIGEIARRWHELETAQGKVLEDAKRFFHNGKGWKAWLKSHKSCRRSTAAMNDALQHVDYSPEGNPAPADTMTRLDRVVRELDDDRGAQLQDALERLIEKYTTAPVERATPEQPELETPAPELPCDATLATVKEWFAALPISQQCQVLATLESANDTVDDDAVICEVPAAARQAEKAAA
jgi:hypothetical protein